MSSKQELFDFSRTQHPPSQTVKNEIKLKEFTVNQARPLPVFLLLDASGSMVESGKIEALNYRRAFDLWHRWERHASTKPPTAQERAAARRRAVEDWDLFVILLTLRASRQLALTPPEAFDALRIFGADMCAALLPPTTAPFLPRSTECPFCKPMSS
jgi:hypothetical protein